MSKFRFRDRSHSEKNFVLGTGLTAKKNFVLGTGLITKKFELGLKPNSNFRLFSSFPFSNNLVGRIA